MSPRSANPFLNREASWLEFNSRVLEEARDPKNPLLERLRFFCIFFSNLDEFFMVRVASVLRRIHEGHHKPDPAGFTPFQELEFIDARVRELEETAHRLYAEELLPALGREKIRILPLQELTSAQQKFLDSYFETEIYPVLTPIAIDETIAFPRLVALAFNLAVLLRPEKAEEGKETKLAVVQVPGRMPGLCRLPETSGIALSWLSDLVRSKVAVLFSGYRVVEVAGFRLALDSELELDDEGGDDYVRMLEVELKKRRKARPIRVEYEEGMSAGLLARIEAGLDITRSVLFAIRRPLDPRPLFSLVDMPGFDRLRYPPQPPLMPLAFEQERGVFEIIGDGDVLLHHPYDSFDPVVEFIQAAADDPDVLAVKQTLYRTSGKASPLVGALIRAAENGKQVTVLIELTARFDEERNISWARDLEDAGAHVLYGTAGLKVHAKIALVVRREPRGIRRYVHLGTGNYNERTTRLYTDFGLLTASDDIGSDASGFFNTITGYSEPPAFNQLVMAPLGIRDRILSLIRREADRARSGQVSGVIAKMNSLVDPLLIQELCTASSAGVAVSLIVRGVCCLRPGIANMSENIRVISIVDRYLEHSRAFVFRNGGDPVVYLSSADWMPRNLDRRVELMFPVLEESAKKRVIQVLETQLADNQKARVLRSDGSYIRVSPGRAEPLRVQEYLYRRALDERERVRSVTPVRFVPIEAKE
jgi:polyphosphate kinase